MTHYEKASKWDLLGVALVLGILFVLLLTSCQNQHPPHSNYGPAALDSKSASQPEQPPTLADLADLVEEFASSPPQAGDDSSQRLERFHRIVGLYSSRSLTRASGQATPSNGNGTSTSSGGASTGYLPNQATYGSLNHNDAVPPTTTYYSTTPTSPKSGINPHGTKRSNPPPTTPNTTGIKAPRSKPHATQATSAPTSPSTFANTPATASTASLNANKTRSGSVIGGTSSDPSLRGTGLLRVDFGASPTGAIYCSRNEPPIYPMPKHMNYVDGFNASRHAFHRNAHPSPSATTLSIPKPQTVSSTKS